MLHLTFFSHYSIAVKSSMLITITTINNESQLSTSYFDNCFSIFGKIKSKLRKFLKTPKGTKSLPTKPRPLQDQWNLLNLFITAHSFIPNCLTCFIIILLFFLSYNTFWYFILFYFVFFFYLHHCSLEMVQPVK